MAPSTPSFSSFCWNAGMNSFIFVFAFTLRRIRQMTSVIPLPDMRKRGIAKYHSCVMNFRKACMVLLPGRQSDGRYACECRGAEIGSAFFVHPTEKVR